MSACRDPHHPNMRLMWVTHKHCGGTCGRFPLFNSDVHQTGIDILGGMIRSEALIPILLMLPATLSARFLSVYFFSSSCSAQHTSCQTTLHQRCLPSKKRQSWPKWRILRGTRSSKSMASDGGRMKLFEEVVRVIHGQSISS